LEIQQTAIRQLTTEQEATAAASVTAMSLGTPPAAANTNTTHLAAVTTDANDSESEAEQEEAGDTTPDLPKLSGSCVTSTTDNKKMKVSSLTCEIHRYQYLGPRGRKWREAGEDCMMRSFITCMLHQMLFG